MVTLVNNNVLLYVVILITNTNCIFEINKNVTTHTVEFISYLLQLPWKKNNQTVVMVANKQIQNKPNLNTHVHILVPKLTIYWYTMTTRDIVMHSTLKQ